MDQQLRQYLARIAEALERQNKILVRFIPENEDDAERCPACGSVDTQNTSTMGNPRMTCGDCSKSWEATSG